MHKKQKQTSLISKVVQLEGLQSHPHPLCFGPTRLYFCPLVFNDALCGNSIRLQGGGCEETGLMALTTQKRTDATNGIFK